MQKAIIEGPAQVDTTQVLRRFRVVYSAIRTHFQTVEKQVGLGCVITPVSASAALLNAWTCTSQPPAIWSSRC